MLIQSYESADEREVVALWRDCGLLVPHNDPVADIAFCRASGHGEVFVGREGDRIAAALMAGHDGHRGWLYYLAVDPGRRHAGLAREITAHAEHWLAGLGVRKVQLMIRDTNAAVREFYAAIGYAQEPRVVMARWLVDKDAVARGGMVKPTKLRPGKGGKSIAKPKAERVPAGKLRSVITYLEMREAPGGRALRRPHGVKLALMRAERPTVSFYRYLYDSVGEAWLWWERRAMPDRALETILGGGKVEVYVLYAAGVPAGFAEIDRRQEPEIELAYFGLLPDFIGAGLGGYFLNWAVEAAWAYEPTRLWVHSCDFDHPSALAVYQRAGFVPYDQKVEVVDDPRLAGLIPMHVKTPAEQHGG